MKQISPSDSLFSIKFAHAIVCTTPPNTLGSLSFFNDLGDSNVSKT